MPGLCEKLHAAASKLRWNWRERFRSGYWLPRYVRIAITPDTVHPAHGAAIVEMEKVEAILILFISAELAQGELLTQDSRKETKKSSVRAAS
jgi:hypothetical protein